jgi:hypothetical protein
MDYLYSNRWTCTLTVGEPVVQPATAIWIAEFALMAGFGLLPTRTLHVTTRFTHLRDLLSIV